MSYALRDIDKIAEQENLDPAALRVAYDNAYGFSVRAVGPGSVPEELCLGATVMAVKHYLKSIGEQSLQAMQRSGMGHLA
jgi:hypothetical protein